MNYELKPLAGGTVTTPRGFQAGGMYVGVKPRADGKPDVGLLCSEAPCVAAGVFTGNRIKAAPVLVSQRHLADGRARAVVVNSGCANACSGAQGLADATRMAELAAQRLGITPDEVLVASTGVIGVNLPLDRIERGIREMLLSSGGGHELARTIMTTDTRPKEAAVAVEVGGSEVVVGGVAKGAGMIHPNMATLLAFLATDAAVTLEFLDEALRRAVADSFNMVTIDGDTSTNDTLVILANGLAGNEVISGGVAGEAFQAALNEVCIFLAKALAADGEGATRLITVVVEGAASEADARAGARTIASSALVKSAVHGCDPNWGRIAAALGRSGAELDEGRLEIYVDRLCLMRGGAPVPFNEDEARAILRRQEVPVTVRLNLGASKATAWGCDLSQEYVTINSAYTT